MANISAKDVAELRKKTGCGMMECKKALVEANGDMDEAIKVLRERGIAVAAKKADRIAAEGVVDIAIEGNVGAIIEVNSETDFVAKNDTFKTFVANLLHIIVTNKPADVAALNACVYEGETTVEAKLKELIFQIGENMSIRRFDVVEGDLVSYIHGKGQIGVLVKFEAEDAAAANEAYAEVKKNIALHIAAQNAVPYICKEDVPASVIAEEKEVLVAQLKNDPANAKKPQQVLDKIVEGRLSKFYEANCLLNQEYVKAENKETVEKYLANMAKDLGGAIKVCSFLRYEKGEGLQKREENFAEEIEKMVNGK
ncbi:MAG: translation elongation factor Ts [Clostridia bacterium]|nr:translation elongation factor Ts [Clostridia bacterium]